VNSLPSTYSLQSQRADSFQVKNTSKQSPAIEKILWPRSSTDSLTTLAVEAAFYAGLAISQECGPALRTSSETWDSNFEKFSRKRSASFLACSS
jgi:hypothetical protein